MKEKGVPPKVVRFLTGRRNSLLKKASLNFRGIRIGIRPCPSDRSLPLVLFFTQMRGLYLIPTRKRRLSRGLGSSIFGLAIPHYYGGDGISGQSIDSKPVQSISKERF